MKVKVLQSFYDPTSNESGRVNQTIEIGSETYERNKDLFKMIEKENKPVRNKMMTKAKMETKTAVKKGVKKNGVHTKP